MEEYWRDDSLGLGEVIYISFIYGIYVSKCEREVFMMRDSSSMYYIHYSI